MAMTKSVKTVKEFLPASYRLQLEKEAEAAEERSKFSDGPGRYLTAPKETTDEKGRKVAGTCEFRVMSNSDWGWQLWYTNEDGDKRCQRWYGDDLTAQGIQNGQVPEDQLPPNYDAYEKSGKPKIKRYVSMVVYNIGEATFQIMDLVPETLQKQFNAACLNPKWDSPLGYDFLWTRTGEKLSTEHTLQPQPHYEVPAEIKARFDALEVDLVAHLRGAQMDEVWGDIELKTDD